jgi:hypothetical protein
MVLNYKWCYVCYQKHLVSAAWGLFPPPLRTICMYYRSGYCRLNPPPPDWSLWEASYGQCSEPDPLRSVSFEPPGSVKNLTDPEHWL